MIEAIIGIILATTASVSLLITLGISNKTIKNSGRESLSISEKEVIRKAGYSIQDINKVELDIKSFIFK